MAKKTNKYQKEYRRSIDGFLIHLHHRMVNRTKGITTNTPELYLGLSVLSRTEFSAWLVGTEEGARFFILYAQWQASGYKRTHTPSIDRIDSSLGYVEGNIRWVTASQNSSLVHAKPEPYLYRTSTSTSKQSA